MKRKKYDKIPDEIIEDVLEDVSSGTSMSEACTKRGVSIQAIRYRLTTDSALSSRYAHARFSQARSQFEEMQHLEQRVLDGDLDPNAYRVVADSRKWRLAKLHPSEYGDKQHLEVSGSIDIAGRIVESRRRAQVEAVETVEQLKE